MNTICLAILIYLVNNRFILPAIIAIVGKGSAIKISVVTFCHLDKFLIVLHFLGVFARCFNSPKIQRNSLPNLYSKIGSTFSPIDSL